MFEATFASSKPPMSVTCRLGYDGMYEATVTTESGSAKLSDSDLTILFKQAAEKTSSKIAMKAFQKFMGTLTNGRKEIALQQKAFKARVKPLFNKIRLEAKTAKKSKDMTSKVKDRPAKKVKKIKK